MWNTTIWLVFEVSNQHKGVFCYPPNFLLMQLLHILLASHRDFLFLRMTLNAWRLSLFMTFFNLISWENIFNFYQEVNYSSRFLAFLELSSSVIRAIPLNKLLCFNPLLELENKVLEVNLKHWELFFCFFFKLETWNLNLNLKLKLELETWNFSEFDFRLGGTKMRWDSNIVAFLTGEGQRFLIGIWKVICKEILGRINW